MRSLCKDGNNSLLSSIEGFSTLIMILEHPSGGCHCLHNDGEPKSKVDAGKLAINEYQAKPMLMRHELSIQP